MRVDWMNESKQTRSREETFLTYICVYINIHKKTHTYTQKASSIEIASVILVVIRNVFSSKYPNQH